MNFYPNSDMRKFLEEKANLAERELESYSGYLVQYDETISEDSHNRDFDDDYSDSLEFIRTKSDYSYVYRIGVLAMFDGNKMDFGEFHIGFQSDKDGSMLYLGKLNFSDGENMDIPQTIKRIAYSMLECLKWL